MMVKGLGSRALASLGGDAPEQVYQQLSARSGARAARPLSSAAQEEGRVGV